MKIDDPKPGVLYVDDEEQALKYFRLAFEGEFRVLTAASVAAAEALLDKEGAEIGIVLTDQRMPGETGVDLLSRVRRSRPEIVRMLTTAYSDLESAIEAVNSGAIFKYVVKPWNLRELRGALVGAMELFVVRRHRDLLLREKMSVIERLIVADRVRSLTVLAAGLAHQIRNPMTALSTFLEQAPAKLRAELPPSADLKNPFFWEDFWSLAQREGARIVQVVQQVTKAVVEPRVDFGDQGSLDFFLRRAVRFAEEGGALGKGCVTIEAAASLPPVKADGAMLERLFRILLARVAAMAPSGAAISVKLSGAFAVSGTPGIRVLLSAGGPDWSQERIDSLFVPFALSDRDSDDLGFDLLSAFFIAHHHGGDILIQGARPDGPGFDVRLPLDPEKARRPSPAIADECLRRIYADLATRWE